MINQSSVIFLIKFGSGNQVRSARFSISKVFFEEQYFSSILGIIIQNRFIGIKRLFKVNSADRIKFKRF
jgi:hypothetical protein